MERVHGDVHVSQRGGEHPPRFSRVPVVSGSLLPFLSTTTLDVFAPGPGLEPCRALDPRFRPAFGEFPSSPADNHPHGIPGRIRVERADSAPFLGFARSRSPTSSSAAIPGPDGNYLSADGFVASGNTHLDISGKTVPRRATRRRRFQPRSRGADTGTQQQLEVRVKGLTPFSFSFR